MRRDLGDALLPWERLLWSGRPWQLARRLRGERYLLTDFRIVCASRRGVAEIAPNGEKRDEAEIVRFMERDVMPWARQALGRLKGGADKVSCATCHGADGAARRWTMPAVSKLPQPDVRDHGWEIYSTTMDAQMRNAIYGYLAESENQAKAAYMREIVVPGMARLLRRPAYDFTKSYEYNRSQRALGCYHCHQVQ